ncbi:MAG TPA: hypothetical protein VFO55_10570 [Gemmatimonadaceae bacterium]|nr:hypothetical protein [Gemmatimonadaceae bacterium]
MPRIQRNRKGSALFLVLVMIGALGALAMSAIVLTGNATLVGQSYDKEADLRYAAEAGLSIGKARLNFDPASLPDTGFVKILDNYVVKSVDNRPVSGVAVSVYLGPSGSTTGQFGRFASLVADARDTRGTGFVRRLELTQESFAKFAYWSDKEQSGGGTIYFGGGDHLWGPVWSNDQISINSGRATFHDDVGTAKSISGANYGTFSKGYKTNQKPIVLPSNTKLSKLNGYASAGSFSFAPPTAGSAGSVRMRIEFVALDMNADGDSTDADEGFFRVYEGGVGQSDWVRADWPGYTADESTVHNCGDWHAVGAPGKLKFFPVSVHNTTWFANLMKRTWANGGGNMSNTAANNEKVASLATIMQHTNARCFPGGAPQLAAVERTAALYPDTLSRYIGGDDTTFTASGARGAWKEYSPTPNATLADLRPDARYLFPIHRSLNPGSKGVIYASGSVAVSGVVRGRVTLYATGTVAVIDDLRYANDPGLGVCQDILGIIAGADVMVADNAINTPQLVTSTSRRNFDDTKDFYLHSVMMALNTSFGVESFDTGPTNYNDCEGTNNGRGCLYLSGGVIQVERGAVGQSDGHGFTKRYSYDRCAIMSPPPYFPTTGRFNDSRYYELDPVGFDVRELFKAITPDK